MNWIDTCLDIEQLKLAFNPYHEIGEKNLNKIQKLELKALRTRAIELHYIRIDLNRKK